MKKQDYATLAAAIKFQISKCRRITDNRPINVHCEYAIAKLELLAADLSRSLHVDKQTFLKACGIN